MHVIHGRDHTDDAAILECHDEVMTPIEEKLTGPVRIDRFVEDAFRHALKNASIIRPEQTDLQRHQSRLIGSRA